MELTVTAKNLPSSPALSAYAEKRLAKLSRRLRGDVSMKLVLKKENTRAAEDRYVAEATATLGGGAVLRAEERATDLYAAIDSLSDVLTRQIRRYRTRQSRRKTSLTQWESALLDELSNLEPGGEGATPDDSASESGAGLPVRVKSHPMPPMSVEEAAGRMELLGHSFFVFRNSDGGGINVLYRRLDGGLGMIIPESPGD